MAQQGPPEWLQAFMAQQQQQMAEQQQQMQLLQERQQAQVQALQNALAQTNEAVQALHQPVPTPTPAEATPASIATAEIVAEPRRTKAVLPNPPKFNGNRNEFEGWKSLISDKIEVDGDVIGSGKNQFVYVASRLEGKALQLALTFIT